MRGGVLTGSGHVVAGTSKRYTGLSVPEGSSRVPVTFRLAGAAGGGGDLTSMNELPSLLGPVSSWMTKASEPPTDCTVSSPVRDQTSLATVRSAGRSSGVTVT